jgi:uncharacterized membrane protein YccC
MSISVGLGTLLAPTPIASAIMVGLIGAIATFVFGALKIPGPAAIFFVLGFTMTTGMPLDPALAPLRTGLVLLGGILSWIIGMIPWFFKPHGPETIAVKKVYKELASFIDSVGTDHFNDARQKAVFTLQSAEDTLIAGYTSWRSSDLYKRLLLLNGHANTIFLYILEHISEKKVKLPTELGASVRALADSIDHNNMCTKIRQPEQVDEIIIRLFSKIYDADAIMNEPISKIHREVKFSKPTLKSVFSGAFDKNSMVFLTSVRYGIILMIAAFFAYSFTFNRSYWIPLSCAAVMSGSTIISTFHRAIQRSFGTIIGILIASIILSAKPEGFVIAIIIMLLTFLTELFIVRNYAIAAFFITPNALLLAESTAHLDNVPNFAAARVIDIIIGCFIGLIGTLLIGRKHASSLLPHLMAKTIRSQEQLLLMLFSEHGSRVDFKENRERIKMHTNLINLKIVYTTAIGEIPSNKTALEILWPSIFSIEQLGYLLDACLKLDKRPILADEILSQFLLVFETMAKVAEQKQPLPKKGVPDIPGFSKIKKEINDLQDALQVSKRATKLKV